jgi:hypothetical protein
MANQEETPGSETSFHEIMLSTLICLAGTIMGFGDHFWLWKILGGLCLLGVIANIIRLVIKIKDFPNED